MAFHHPGHLLAYRRGWLPGTGPDGARDIGRAVRKLRPGIDEVDLVGSDRPVAFLGHAVMDDGAVLAGSRDRGKALAAEPGHLLTQREQFGRRGHLGFTATWTGFSEEVQEP